MRKPNLTALPLGTASTPAPKAPSLKTLMKWFDEGISKATDGCTVEPDGTCPHGKPSWLLKLGMI